LFSDQFELPREDFESCEKAMGWCIAQCKMLLFYETTDHHERVTQARLY